MKQLWAPWRLEYIRGDKEKGCFLCRVLAERDDRENLVLARGSCCAVVLNRYPYNNGHLMVCPQRHVGDVTDLSAGERLETMDLVARGIEALRATVAPDGFNVGMNLGLVAGAGLEDHIHTHIVPRWNGDTNFMTVADDVRVIPQALLDMWDELHPVLADEKQGG